MNNNYNMNTTTEQKPTRGRPPRFDKDDPRKPRNRTIWCNEEQFDRIQRWLKAQKENK